MHGLSFNKIMNQNKNYTAFYFYSELKYIIKKRDFFVRNNLLILINSIIIMK